MLLLLLRGPRPVFSVVLCQASVSRELRNTTNLSVVLVIYSACLDLSLTIDIHSERVADTPSVTMGNMIAMTL